MIIKPTILFSFLMISIFAYSNNKLDQVIIGDRIIEYNGYIVLADEPGLAACSDINCNIPVDLHILKKEGEAYELLSKHDLTNINSSEHSLYQYKNVIMDVFTNRIQYSNQSAFFVTHAKLIDVTKIENPTLIDDVKLTGSLIDSQQLNHNLFMLTSSVTSITKKNCLIVNEDVSLNNKIMPDLSSLVFNISNVSMKNGAVNSNHCIQSNISGMQNAGLSVFKDSVYLTYSSFSKRYVHRYRVANDKLVYDRKFILNDSFYTDSIGDYLYEKNGVLIAVGLFEFGDVIQAGLKIYNLNRSEASVDTFEKIDVFSKSLSFTPENKQDNTYIMSVSSNLDDVWHIAIGYEEQNHVDNMSDGRLFSIGTQSAKKPALSNGVIVKGYVEKIIPSAQNIVSIYSSQFEISQGSLPTTALTLFDMTALFNPKLIMFTYLTEGFSHQPLAISDIRTHQLVFNTDSSGRMIFPLQSTFGSPFPSTLDESVDRSRDVPTDIGLELLVFDITKKANCVVDLKSCWGAQKIHTEFLYLPYEGDEPIRARSLLDASGFHYILGKQTQYFEYDSN
ncbi:hypothetical protein ACU6U9_00980 [Pseudomonas sp. HK3]